MSIRKKLALWYTGLLALTIFSFGLMAFGVIRWTMIETADENLEHVASDVLDNLSVGQFGSLRTAFIFKSREVFLVPGVSIQVWQTYERGEPIPPSSIRDTQNYGIPLDASTLGASQPIYTDITLNKVAGRVYTLPFSGGDQPLGVIQVATSVEMSYTATNQLLVIMLAASAVSIVGAIIIGRWVTNRALQPLDEITQAAARIASTDDLTTRLPARGPVDEIGRLTRVFNHMMDRLEHLFVIEQRFVADVSHELRTPLTAIRGNLEIIKRYGMDDESLEAIDNEAERMSHMVNDLLLLARADYGEISVDLYPLDLDTIVLEVFRQAQVLVKDRQLEIKLEHFVPIRIRGNTDRIKQLLLNLVSNAMKFTPDGGTITLGLQPRGGWAALYVRDTGIGIAPEDIDHIFDRFYQAEPSRTQAGRHEGAGLGLSIARWIVEVHEGQISVESEVGVGTTFLVKFPILGKVRIKPLDLDDGDDVLKLRMPVIARAPIGVREKSPDK